MTDLCPACQRPIPLCVCNVEAQTEEDAMIAELGRMQPPAKLRWLASDMERALHDSQMGRVTSFERVRVWAGTLEAMHRGLMQSVEAGGGGQGGNRAQRRARGKLKRVK